MLFRHYFTKKSVTENSVNAIDQTNVTYLEFKCSSITFKELPNRIFVKLPGKLMLFVDYFKILFNILTYVDDTKFQSSIKVKIN